MKNLMIIILLIAMWACNSSPNQEEQTNSSSLPVELGDPALIEITKKGLESFSNKDASLFAADFADNAVYRFNNGDSLAGKQVITDYWTDRFTNAIETLSFSNDLWLSLKSNPSNPGVQPGNWVLGWYRVTATYKTGKSMTQWIHTDYHFDNTGKIDQVIQYLDRAPIMAAMTPDE